jgi:hypothetical protein
VERPILFSNTMTLLGNFDMRVVAFDKFCKSVMEAGFRPSSKLCSKALLPKNPFAKKTLCDLMKNPGLAQQYWLAACILDASTICGNWIKPLCIANLRIPPPNAGHLTINLP